MEEFFVLIFLIFKKLYVYLPQNNLKHQLMKKLILLILILMSGMMPTWAQSVAADDIAQLLDGAFIEVESNVPIGLWPELEFEGEELDNISGKLLFIYTDGLNEAENQA